jgi:hypothetical protein
LLSEQVIRVGLPAAIKRLASLWPHSFAKHLKTGKALDEERDILIIKGNKNLL